MANVQEAQKILEAMGLPTAQTNEISGYTLIALCGLKPADSWTKAQRIRCTITKSIMDFVRDHHGKTYAANTRETFRRQVLHQFVQGHIAGYNPFEPNLPTNSPRAHYAITEGALAVVKTFGTKGWDAAVDAFKDAHGTLQDLYTPARDLERVPIQLPDGSEVRLSPGKHNEVQKAIVEEFAPRFAPGARLLYMGDTAQKNLVVDKERLAALGIPLTDHDKLPDVVLFDDQKKWLFLVEAVTSHGPVSPKRIQEITAMLGKADAGPVYVSAFPDMAEFRKHAKDIAWETEVWLADMPDHMIHFNGDRFLGPRGTQK